MRKILFVALTLIAAAPPEARADERQRRWDLFAGESAAVVTQSGNTSVAPRTSVGIETTFPFGLTLGNDLSYYQVTFGPGKVQNSSVGFRVGWNFFERKLQLVTRYDYVSTTYSNYDAASHEGAGVELIYKLPLDQAHRFFLHLGGGWAYVSEVSLQRDSGLPAVSSDFGNALCSAFTLGISSGCGDIWEHVTIPRSTLWHLGAGVGWVW